VYVLTYSTLTSFLDRNFLGIIFIAASLTVIDKFFLVICHIVILCYVYLSVIISIIIGHFSVNILPYFICFFLDFDLYDTGLIFIETYVGRVACCGIKKIRVLMHLKYECPSQLDGQCMKLYSV